MTSAVKPGSGNKLPLNRKTLKTRTSKLFCQERLACRGSQPEAHYRCHECETFQCESCECVLHETAKFLFHDRVRLPPPDPELLCQWDCKSCNFADVVCPNCDKNFCNHCDAIIHSLGRKKTHVRLPYEKPTENMSQILTDEDMASFTSANEDNQEYVSTGSTHSSIPDVASPAAIIEASSSQTDYSQNKCDGSPHSFLLVNNEEVLQVKDAKDFVQKLGSGDEVCVKVVSIFGNTGEGKSHTLNHAFFDGVEVFHTSAAQASTTIGVWVAFDPTRNILVVDTEGLLGITSNQNKRTRLLLKVLAISDIIIYRTRAGRLHNDLFQFLGDASQAYVRHFLQELRALSERGNLGGPLSSLGPVAIIFHETQHTDIHRTVDGKTPEDQLKECFRVLSLSVDAFSALEYVGVRTLTPPTSFKKLQKSVMQHLSNSSIRSARKPSVIYSALKVLNEKFSGDIEKAIPCMFPDQYFTCAFQCLSCDARCTNSMNHAKDGIPHTSFAKCRYEHQFDNRIYTCKKCYELGKEVVVVPKTSSACDSTWLGLAKYAWSGYVLECPHCGIIYRSRQYWYGNRDPVETVVRTEIRHVWPGGNMVLQGTHNAAWKVIDSVAYLSNTVSSVSAKPTKMLASWMADQVAPSYWVPNSSITHCSKCKKQFDVSDTKHHCRSCGNGFCEDCSTHSRPVPERGWGPSPVRVCDGCFAEGMAQDASNEGKEVMARFVTEAIQNTLGTVVSAIDYPLELIKDSARPAYWVPDNIITHCFVCSVEFSSKIAKHHCRACGEGVCLSCSSNNRPVPSRGWDTPVRVCDSCFKKVNL